LGPVTNRRHPPSISLPAQNLVSAIRRLFLLDMPNRSAALDGLRALAAIWVFNVHVGWMHDISPIFAKTPLLFPLVVAWRSGDLGVDIFFALSGYLIYQSVRRYRAQDIGRFMQKRYTRLAPAYLFSIILALSIPLFGLIAGILVSTICGLIYYVSNRYQASNRILVWGLRRYWIFAVAVWLALFATVLLFHQPMLALAQSPQNPLFPALKVLANISVWPDTFGPLLGVFNAPTWSLSLEFAFYLTIAGLWWARQKYGLRVWAPWLAVAIGAYYLLFVFGAPHLAAYRLRLFDAMRCLAFVVGVLMVRLSENRTAWSRWRPSFAVLGPLGLVGLVAAAYYMGSALGGHKFPPNWPAANAAYWLFVDVCVFLLLGAALTRGSIISRVFGSTPIRILGAISYSIFLVHYPIQLALQPFFPPRGGLAAHWAASLGITLIVAVICFYFLERPYFTAEHPRPVPVPMPAPGAVAQQDGAPAGS
jgi:peptidoglycan/LPS O-acetylase OafA/YrhL